MESWRGRPSLPHSNKNDGQTPPALPAGQPDMGSAKSTPGMMEYEKEVGQNGWGPKSEEPGSKQDQVLAKLLQGREKEWAAVATKRGPLQLLDLPTDILKEIVKEITHTNDLTSLALAHSALHNLAIPHIYSRFDIVWPDAHAVADNRSGVDALTYGLATLVMAQDVFREAPSQRIPHHQFHRCGHCGRLDQCSHLTSTPRKPSRPKIRRGNHFAQFTRKFSLGNGPADWVQEYLITKEGGKMLGTLVALAVARMLNLETFIWDMPTGVLRDVWLALASLEDRDDGQECRLERVWVRWHDNSESPPPASLTSPTSSANPTLMTPAIDHGFATTHTSLFQIPPYPRVEFPTFSILPPLKCLSVLDIDELPYAEEMSILIEKSVHKLRELRIGIAQHARFDVWVRPIDDKVHSAPPTVNSDLYHSRPGGVLGLLVSRFCDAFGTGSSSVSPPAVTSASVSIVQPLAGELQASLSEVATELENTVPELLALKTIPSASATETTIENSISEDIPTISKMHGLASSMATCSLEPEGQDSIFLTVQTDTEPVTSPSPPKESIFSKGPVILDRESATFRSKDESPPDLTQISHPEPLQIPKLRGYDKFEGLPNPKLRLEVLELERVPISIPVLSKAIDWSRLTTLTILGCRDHEQLWRALRKKFTPFSPARSTPSRNASKIYGGRAGHHLDPSTPKSALSLEDYPLKIQRLHTDAVSPALISFIKETLAPESLEWLFLQEGRPYKSDVTIDSIYRGAIKRHRSSLKKLLISSEERSEDGSPGPNNNWRKWMLNREILSCITSGRMTSLRELGMAIDYKDWHFFLQRLPYATQLRSLFIPHIAEHVHGRSDPREIALQILDIVALRPELELCYLGIQSKCFEILELSVGRKGVTSDLTPASHDIGIVDAHADSDGSDDGNDDDEADDATPPVDHPIGHDDGDSETASSRGDETEDEYGDVGSRNDKQFKLREILFYDDKVSIFKARHGKL